MATNGTFNHQDAYKAPSENSSSVAGTDGNASARATDDTHTPPDQIGWYFVEQYYTTLSKTPDRLHLYYSKASQFVCGLEAEVASVIVGRHAIQERIAGLDFQDTKVRVSNVDSQGSGDHIIIQVIGEYSNKGGEPKKFVQTFVLARQPTGYFVLNDILRYIDEEAEPEAEPEEVAGQQPATAGDQAVAKAEPETDAPPAYEEVAQSADVQPNDLDKELAEVEADTNETVPAPVSEAPAEAVVQADEPVAQAEDVASPEPEPEMVTAEVAEEVAKKPEVPKEPRSSVAPTAAEPEKPREPPRPMTWANRAAAAVPRVVPVALPKTAPTAAPAPAKPAAAPVAATSPPSQPAAAPSSAAQAAAASKAESEWKTAETKRSSRIQPTAAPAEKENRFAYIKNVTDKVQEQDLKRELEQYGTLDRLEMNTMRSCAFADFTAPPDWSLISKNGPLLVSGERMIVEPRRPRANLAGNYSRGGAASGRGRGGYDRGARSGSQGSGRGGFSGGSIRGGPPRPRGNIQVSNA